MREAALIVSDAHDLEPSKRANRARTQASETFQIFPAVQGTNPVHNQPYREERLAFGPAARVSVSVARVTVSAPRAMLPHPHAVNAKHTIDS